MFKIFPQTISALLRNTKTIISLEHDCIICQKATILPICDDCFDKITLPKYYCQQCGVSLISETLHQRCVDCISKPPAYDLVNYLGIYEKELRQLILSAKIQKSVAAISALNYIISRLVNERLIKNNNYQDYVILPVPTPTFRLIFRGFDFPLLLAKLLHKHSDIELLLNVVRIPFYVKKQANLKLSKRINNKHKYRIKLNKLMSSLPEKVIIFDDVITTGNTTNELAKLLKKHGVKHVIVWAIARGQMN